MLSKACFQTIAYINFQKLTDNANLELFTFLIG